MKTICHRLKHWIAMFSICMQLVLGGTAVVHAEEKSEAVRRKFHHIIEQKFPGSTITEIEKGELKGEPITEVDFTTEDGVAHEARISDSGKILTVKIDKD